MNNYDDARPDELRVEDVSSAKNVPLLINEVQLLLAEKRTVLAVLRTGITIFVLPLSVLSVLIATSKFYNIVQVMHFMVPVLTLCAGLVFLAIYLVIRALKKLHVLDLLINELKKKCPSIATLIT